ncbi:hypothetical protein EDB80DRAFT_691698 [Ilyonectria destructans]|nr:hypothetical protein EDB80DRAFT_691698 [Ilyonectria destructans]
MHKSAGESCAAPVEHMGLSRIIQKPFRAHVGTFERSETASSPSHSGYSVSGGRGGLLMEYTTDRPLTRPSDRLPAFLGVSTFMAQHIGSRFIGGLWDGEWFAESICWAVKTPFPASTITSSQASGNAAAAAAPKPSWTRTSLPDAPVTLEQVHAPDREKHSLVSNVSFDHVQISSSQSRVTGAIRLHGRIGRFDKTIMVEPMWFQHPIFDCADRGVQDGEDDLWFLDVMRIGWGKPPEKQPSGMGYGSVRYACPRGMPSTKVQLLLRKVMGKDKNVFRRVGVRNPFPNAFSNPISLSTTVEEEDSIEEADITVV